VSLLVLETGLGSGCYGGSSGLTGSNQTVALYSPTSRVNCVRPILGVACVCKAADQQGAVDLWAAYQPIMIYSTSCVGHVRPIAGAVCICGAADQRRAVDLWAAYQPITIYSTSCDGHVRPISEAVFVCESTNQNWKILVNNFFREFSIIERVTSPARLRATSSINVQVTSPVRFQNIMLLLTR